MARWWMLGAVLLVPACAPKPAAPPPQTGPVYSTPFAADAVTTPSQAREGAFQAGAARCAAMGRRFELIEEQVDWSRQPPGSAGVIRFRCA